ncbi:MAG: hypothetical protein IKJ80_05275 [Clostridia bacterium]|nr:hypothetical protein [Clostridia bacterium]
MAITNFISTVWSENLLTALDNQYVAVANCNRDFEGEIKGKGDRVKVCGLTDVTVFDYNKNTDFELLAEELTDFSKTLVIDQAKAFNFQIDDIDRVQSSPKLMDGAMKVAASALANEADKYVFSLFGEAGSVITEQDTTVDNIIEHIIDARTKLLQNNVSDPADIVVEVSPTIAALILKSKIAISNSDSTLETGCIGNVAGCKIYVSNNIAVADGAHKCLARTKRAIAFAEQLSEVDAYRPEKRFADAVKGLHLYGAKVIYPAEMVLLDLTIN